MYTRFHRRRGSTYVVVLMTAVFVTLAALSGLSAARTKMRTLDATNTVTAARFYAEAAAEISDRTGTPILVATEMASARPDNAGPAAVRATGRLCHASAARAVRSLDSMCWRAGWLRRRQSR